MKNILFRYIILIVFVLVSFKLYSKKITVDKNGKGNYKSISEAFNYSEEGDTIFIKNGIYIEDSLILPKDKLCIIGESNQKTIISGTHGVPVFTISSGSSISNIYIELKGEPEGYAFLKTGIYVSGVMNVKIHNCRFNGGECAITVSNRTYNETSADIGNNIIESYKYTAIYLENSYFEVYNNLILNDSIDANAINFMRHCSGEIYNNTILRSGEAFRSGYYDTLNVKIYNNIIAYCNVVMTVPENILKFYKNICWKNYSNFSDWNSDKNYEISDNLFVDPMFVNYEKGDYHLNNSSPALKSGVYGKNIGADIYKK